MFVRDIPEDFVFVSDSQDVFELNEWFGEDFDSYFVKVLDGEYIKVYGMYGIIPLVDKNLFFVK